jgi:NADPH:quinone reductase-like Zn-dependent oxidoreductase
LTLKTILFHQHGPAEVLQFVTNHPVPLPGPGEVRLKVAAAALNYLDIWVRDGWPGIQLHYPHIPGADAAGTIDALGEGVSGWSVGDRVAVDPTLSCGHCAFCRAGQENCCIQFAILGEHVNGSYAEYVTVPARNVVALPGHVSFAEAAAASLVFVTAWHSLITRGGLHPAETVLIVGAGGGVNTASLQIAKLAGCTVIVVGSSDEKLAQAKALGADAIIRRDVEGGWSRAVYQITAKRGVDVVVDNVGAATFKDSLRALARGGRLLTVGNTSGPITEIDNRLMFGKHLSIIGSTMGPHHDYVTVMNLVFKGKLKAIIGATYPLAEAQAAQRALESGAVFGKIVLEI